MLETIYTIPVNEAFDACRDDGSLGCPFCRMKSLLDEKEIDLILGASMMEPDVRIKTNEQGFCGPHFKKMLAGKNRLGLALILESHLADIKKDCKDPVINVKGKGGAAVARISKLEKSCYVCSRIEAAFSKMIENAVLLFAKDRDFREKFSAQPYFCLPHYKRISEAAKRELDKKEYSLFADSASKVVNGYFDSLCEDVSWFCKKFDYRYDAEPWGNAKDAPDRAVRFLGGSDE